MKALARNNYSRNLWAIMDRFKVLPSNPDFQNLTNEQLEWIIYSSQLDNKKYSPGENFADYDESWFNKKEFSPLRDGDDEEDIARQVEELTTEEEAARLKARWEGAEDAEAFAQSGEKSIEEQSIDDMINAKIEDAKKEARNIEKYKSGNKHPDEEKQEAEDVQFQENLDSGSIQDAIDLFEGDQDDDFEI